MFLLCFSENWRLCRTFHNCISSAEAYANEDYLNNLMGKKSLSNRKKMTKMHKITDPERQRQTLEDW